MEKRRLILCSVDIDSAKILYNFLRLHLPSVVVDRVIFERRESRIPFLKRRVRRLGLFPVLGQVLFQVLVPPLLRIFSSERLRQIDLKYEFDRTPIPESLVTRLESINSQDARQILQAREPDLVLLHGTRIVSANTLSCIDCPWVNMHAGITPYYRGSHGGYWALYESDPERCGISVHLVDAGIDSGGILGQALIYPEPEDNFVTYGWLQLGVGLRPLAESIQRVLEGTARPIRSPDKGTLYFHPTLCQYLSARLGSSVK